MSPKRRDVSVSPVRRSISCGRHSVSPKWQSGSPGRRPASPKRRSPSPTSPSMSHKKRGSISVDRRSPHATQQSRSTSRRRSPSPQRRSLTPRRRTISREPRRRSISPKRDSPSPNRGRRNMSPAQRIPSPARGRSGSPLRHSPAWRRRSPPRRRRPACPTRSSTSPKKRSPSMKTRSPSVRRHHDRTPERRRSAYIERSRSPVRRRSRSPVRRRSPGPPENSATTEILGSAGARKRSSSGARRMSLGAKGHSKTPSERRGSSPPVVAERADGSRRNSNAAASDAAERHKAGHGAHALTSETNAEKRDEERKAEANGREATAEASEGRRVSKWKSRWGVAAPAGGSLPSAASGGLSDSAVEAAAVAAPLAAADSAASPGVTVLGGRTEISTSAAFPFKKNGAAIAPTPVNSEAPGGPGDSGRAAERYLGALEAKPKIKIVLSRTAQQQQQRQLRGSAAQRDESDAISAAALAEAYLLATGEREETAAAANGRPQESPQPEDRQARDAESSTSPAPPGETATATAPEESQERSPDGLQKASATSEGGETGDATGGSSDSKEDAAAASQGRESGGGADADEPPRWRRPQPPLIRASDGDASPARSSGSSRASPAIPLASALEAHRLQAAKSATAAESGDEGSRGSRTGGDGSNMFRRRRLGRDGIQAPRKQVSEEETAAPPEQLRDSRRRSRSSSRSSRDSIDGDAKGYHNATGDYRGRRDYHGLPPSPPRGPRGNRSSRDRDRNYYHYGAPYRGRGGDWRGAEGPSWRETSRGYDDRWDRDPRRRHGDPGYRRERWGDCGGKRRSPSGPPGGAPRYEARNFRHGRDDPMQRRSRSRTSGREDIQRRRQSLREFSVGRDSPAGSRDARRHRESRGSPMPRAEEKPSPPPLRRERMAARRDSLPRKDASPSPKRRRAERPSLSVDGRRTSLSEAALPSPPRSKASPLSRRSASRDAPGNRKHVKPAEGRVCSPSPRVASPKARRHASPLQAREHSLSPVRDRRLSPLGHRELPSPRRCSAASPRHYRPAPRDQYLLRDAARRSPAPSDRRGDNSASGKRERCAVERTSLSPSPSERERRSRKPHDEVSPGRSPSTKRLTSPRGERGRPTREASPRRSQSPRVRDTSPRLQRSRASKERAASFARTGRLSSSASPGLQQSVSESVGRCPAKEDIKAGNEGPSRDGRWQQQGRNPSPLPAHSPGRATYDRETGRPSAYKRGRYELSPSRERSPRRSKGSSKGYYSRRCEDEASARNANDRGYGAATGRERDISRGMRGRSRSPSWDRRSWGRRREDRPYWR